MRFLLVEDNEQLAKAICDRLSLDSHIVDHAGNLSLASEHVAATTYDLILLDIMLPDGMVDGFCDAIVPEREKHL